MKASELQQIIREEIGKVLKEKVSYTREDIEQLLQNNGEIEKKYDYTWVDDDKLNFHNNKDKATEAFNILSTAKVVKGQVQYLFGDYYINLHF